MKFYFFSPFLYSPFPSIISSFRIFLSIFITRGPFQRENEKNLFDWNWIIIVSIFIYVIILEGIDARVAPLFIVLEG